MKNKIDNRPPFQPDSPVFPSKFKGREDILEEYSIRLKHSTFGNPQHFFTTGEAAMGKSSLATYLLSCARRKYKMVGVHVYNDGVHTTEDLISQIITEILNEIEKETWSAKIFSKIKENVESISVYGTKIKFRPKKQLIENVKDNFAGFLSDLVNDFDKEGIFIVIDDVNGLSDTPEFAFWYKSFADSLFTNFRNKAPITIMLTGYPDKLRKLNMHNPSFTRIFKHALLTKLDETEVKEFYEDIFNELEIKIEKEALDKMTAFSFGIPLIMQEIGYRIYWMNNDDLIVEDTAVKGIKSAADELSFKYLNQVTNPIFDKEKFAPIINKLGELYLNQGNHIFTKEDLNINDEELLDEFIGVSKKLNIIRDNEYKGLEYGNHLYGPYFAMQTS